jgi:glutamyl/glutaminyl-tRNA synthetase
MEKKESCKRNTTPQENLAIFEKLLKGEPDAQKYCLRAKIDMTSVNGTLRDPVLYRWVALYFCCTSSYFFCVSLFGL